MNLCYPDPTKSCASCCGLYNVRDGERRSLQAKLEHHTELYRKTDRTLDELLRYADRIACEESGTALDPDIHVCEFVGFVDTERRTPACLLHPTASGNGGVDLRGLCHYGAMACKSFYCPAWRTLEPHEREILVAVIDDWHTFGLVATDLDFVRSVFGFVEWSLGEIPDVHAFLSERASSCLRHVFDLKNSWPPGNGSKIRRSRYYFKPLTAPVDNTDNCLERIVQSLCFTFGVRERDQPARTPIEERLIALVKAL